MERISIGKAGPANYGEVDKVERLKKDFGIRAILALILVTAAVIFVGISLYTGKNIPEAFMTMVGMVVQAYFMNRATLDK
jgi:hypothetical protein